MRFRVCRADEVPRGEIRAFDVDGLAVPVLVANLDGILIAASGMCPHEDVELIGGSYDGTSIVCPGHGYEFDLASGACSHDDTLCLPTYQVTVVAGEVYVTVI
jgi:nitrite reductase/ring-hydroxylating ferredoxin subunit